MFKVTIFLKSGTSFDVYLEKITTTNNGNEITSIKWTGADEVPQLHHVNPIDISAIITEWIEPEDESNPGQD